MQEKTAKMWSAALSVLVHLLFLALLVFAVHWKNPPSAVVTVRLWGNLPTAKRQFPVKPKFAVKVPLPTPPVPVKTDIKLKAKQERLRRILAAQRQKQAVALRRQQVLAAARAKKRVAEERLRRALVAQRQKQAMALRRQRALVAARAKKRMAEERLRRALVVQQQKQAAALRRQQALAAATASRQVAARIKIVNTYRDKIQSKIRPLINNQACLSLGQPTAVFHVTLMPTGELLMAPQRVKTSGKAACDQAIERAIIRAQPLPLPPDRSLFDQFRELQLSFQPNQ